MLEKQSWPVCCVPRPRQKQKLAAGAEADNNEDGMDARHLESPNEATNATKLKLAEADQKHGPCPLAPGCLSSGRLCKAMSH